MPRASKAGVRVIPSIVARVAVLGLLVALAGLVEACAGRPSGGTAPLDTEDLLLREPAGAFYRDGRLVLHYELGGEQAFLAAAWPSVDLSPDEHNFRMAVLDLALDPPESSHELHSEWQPVQLFGYDRWRRVVNDLLERLAPVGLTTATLVTVQQTDFVLQRTDDGRLSVVRLEASAAPPAIVRRISKEEFTAEANEFLKAELAKGGVGAGPVLFAVGEDDLGGTFVLFDFEHRQSVFIAHAPSESPPGRHLDFSLRLIDAVTLRSHVLTAVRQPVTLTHRLFWLTAHSGAAVLPRGISASRNAPELAAREPMDLAAWEDKLDSLVGPDRYRGRMTLLIDGEAFFETFIQAVLEARSSVDVRLYIFDRDDYALRIADLLRQRSHEIKVRVLIDRLGSLAAGRLPERSPYHTRIEPHLTIADYLRQESNVAVRVVDNPWFTSDHTKVIIVDNERAYVGGMNIGREYRYEWHDLMVEVSGPIVGRLKKDFRKRWAHTGLGGDAAFALAAMRRERYVGAPDDPEYMDIRPLYTRTGDAQILRAQLAAIRKARSRIYIQQPYVSDDQVVAELIRARQRGVDVRFILPSRSDSGFMDSANLITAKALIRNGVRVYVYPGMTHVKAAVYDGWAIVGSANFDKLSLRINQETNLATSDARFVEPLVRELFEVDIARSKEWTEVEPVGWRDYIGKIIAEQL
jgi:cardiolipin synthase A/B